MVEKLAVMRYNRKCTVYAAIIYIERKPTMLKILHCADVHLDSPFASLSADRAEVRRNELRAAFTSMLLYARLNGCDIILMAGDIVDSAFATRDTAALMIREFSAMPKTHIVISPGNHDPYTKGSIWASADFPSNVHIFDSDKLSYFSFDELNVDVYGYAFTSANLEACPFSGCRPVNADRVNLLCAHGDMTSPISNKCPITRSDLESCGFTYAALGHIHNTTGITHSGSTHYGYSGCLEGRDFGECGHKGAMWVTVDGDLSGGYSVSAKGIRFSKKRYEILELDLTGMSDVPEVTALFKSEAQKKGYGADTILRVVLGGCVAPSLKVSASDLGDGVCELVDDTLPVFDADYLKNDPGIRGAFYRELLPMLEGDDAVQRRVAREALRLGLGEI